MALMLFLVWHQCHCYSCLPFSLHLRATNLVPIRTFQLGQKTKGKVLAGLSHKTAFWDRPPCGSPTLSLTHGFFVGFSGACPCHVARPEPVTKATDWI